MLFVDTQTINYFYICVTNCAGVDRWSIFRLQKQPL
nr:MAG TPA: hypothetical protein [Caudoviricetes sp.]